MSCATTIVKVRKSRKKNMLSWILPKNERWGIFMYWKLPQRSFLGRIQDAIIWFWDLLTFSSLCLANLFSISAPASQASSLERLSQPLHRYCHQSYIRVMYIGQSKIKIKTVQLFSYVIFKLKLFKYSWSDMKSSIFHKNQVMLVVKYLHNNH